MPSQLSVAAACRTPEFDDNLYSILRAVRIHHPLRLASAHHEALANSQGFVEIGCSSPSTPASAPPSMLLPSNCSSSECGSVASLTPGMTRPRRLCQNRLAGNVSSHQLRQRSSVCRLAPNSSLSWRARNLLTPCCSADARTTTAPKYTRRPRNRADGGVARVRHPSAAQQ